MELKKYFTTVILMLCMVYSSHAFHDDSLTKYNWAISGLNIRLSNDINSAVTGKVPFGESVRIIAQREWKEYALEIKELFRLGENEEKPGYYLEGYWVKIRYGAIEGFVFDGYLSKLPPMDWTEDSNGNKYIEDFESYMRRSFHPIDSTVLRDINSDLSRKRIQYENGAIYENNGNVGWYEEILILPGADIDDGFLMFYLLNNVPEIRNLPDNEKMNTTECGPQCIKFQANRGGEQFEIHQFGSTLIIRISDSC